MKKREIALFALGILLLSMTLSACKPAVSSTPGTSSAPGFFAAPKATATLAASASPAASGSPAASAPKVSAAPAVSNNTNKTDYWPKEAPDTKTVETALWKFNAEDINGLVIISVSPSGKYILAADQTKQNFAKRNAAGIPNPLGRLPDCLYVFTNQNGVFSKTSSIQIDVDANLELSSTLGVSREDGVAWSKDETRAIITVGLISIRSYVRSSRSDIYLAEFSKQTFKKLTSAKDTANHNLLPQWADNDNIRFIRLDIGSDKSVTSLMGMNLKTGTEERLSDLSADGNIVLVNDYRIAGDSMYFSSEGLASKNSGFYKAKLDGGKTPPACLLNLEDIRQDNIQPYASMFSSVQLSPDGSWVCLTAHDQRFDSRDIPTVDDPLQPQSDPGSAKSVITHKAWVPCHNVFLYDLKAGKLVDPFKDQALRPTVVIATAAAFAPDGKSLVCAVFGDGGKWMQESFKKTTLYQVRLDDSSFSAVRISKVDVEETPNKLSWLGNNSLLIRTWQGIPPKYPVQFIIPSAFKRFVS